MAQLPNQSIVDDLIELLRSEADDIHVTDLRVGVFYTGIKLSTGYGGVAFTPVQEIPEAVCCPRSYSRMPDAGSIVGRRLEEVLGYARSKNPLKCAVGVAAINAASHEHVFNKHHAYKIHLHKDALEIVDIKGDHVVSMIGAFTPYIKKLKGVVKELHVYERSGRALEEEGLPPKPTEPMRAALQRSDIVIITGSALVTQTLDEILSYTCGAREVILVGPTSSMRPDPLFRRGVTVIGGVRIDDADRMLRIVGEAGSAYTLLKECATRFSIRGAYNGV